MQSVGPAALISQGYFRPSRDLLVPHPRLSKPAMNMSIPMTAVDKGTKRDNECHE
jgi:hypothetical protein